MMTNSTLKLAILIDADNSSAKKIPLILQEVAKYGIASVKRVYGDWSSEHLKNWRGVLLPHAITPIQQFAYTSSKDATDMMLIINAMDLLYSNALDGFCIVSSDSDFTPLASRIRESGLIVYGFGEKSKTSEAFINACDKFIYIENLTENSSENPLGESIKNKEDVQKLPQKMSINDTDHKKEPKIDDSDTKIMATKIEPVININQEVKIDDQTLQLIDKAIKEIADDDGFANLSALGSYLVTVKPDFDTRNYGRSTLSKLLQALDLFEIEQRGSQRFVRKRKGFADFLKYVDKVLSNRYGVNHFAKIEMLAKWIKYDCNVNAKDYGFENIENMLKNINSKKFEINSNKTQIKLLSIKPSG